MWPFKDTERQGLAEAARAGSVADIAREAERLQLAADAKAKQAREAAAEAARTDEATREKEAAERLAAQRKAFEAAKLTATTEAMLAELAPEFAEIIALEGKLRRVIERVETKVAAFNARGIEVENLARAVGSDWTRVRFDSFNARAFVTAKLGETRIGRGVDGWIAPRQ